MTAPFTSFPIPTVPFGPVTIKEFGAVGDGITDDAPAFRAAMASNRVLIIDPGTYLFKSLVANPFIPPPCAVSVDSLSNFAIFGYGATINIDPSINNNSTAFIFTRNTNFQVLGLTINQNNSGGPTLNAGIGLVSNVNFRIADINFGPQLVDQALYGDWLVNGVIEHINVTHGQAIDMAYLLHMVLKRD